MTNIWMEAFPWSSGLEKKIQDPGHLKINPPQFFSRPKSDGKASIQIGFFFLSWKRRRFSFKMMPWSQFWLLMEEKWWFGKPATSSLTWWAPKKRGFGNTFTKEETGFRCLSLVFQAKPWNTGRPFHNQVKPGCRFCTEMHWNLPARFCSKIVAFF